MKTVSMSGSLRENVGKKDAKAARREGKIPCVLYGGKEQVHFSIEEKILEKIIFTPEVAFINIELKNQNYKAILQDIQYHPVTDKILHADFLELIEGKQIIMSVPIKVKGVAPGILRGGRLIQKLRKIKIKALPEYIPENITINIDKLDIGDSVKICDLEKENITLLDPKNAVVIGVRVTRVVEEAPTEEAAAGAETTEASAEATTDKSAE